MRCGKCTDTGKLVKQGGFCRGFVLLAGLKTDEGQCLNCTYFVLETEAERIERISKSIKERIK